MFRIGIKREKENTLKIAERIFRRTAQQTYFL
jgi:hypothetical protein